MQYVDNYTFHYLATFPTSIHNLLYFLTAKLLNISTPCIQNIDLERWLLKLGCLIATIFLATYMFTYPLLYTKEFFNAVNLSKFKK